MGTCCLALTEANGATKESETANGLRLTPAAKPSSQKVMALPSNNAVKGTSLSNFDHSLFFVHFDVIFAQNFFLFLYFLKIT